MRTSTHFIKKLTALLLLALTLAVTLPLAPPPNPEHSETEGTGDTKESNKELNNPETYSGASLCSDLETPPPPALN